MNDKVLLLLSGGIDSPVAGFLVKNAGYEIIALHFTAQPFYGEESKEKAKKIAQTLGIKELHVCNIGLILSKIASSKHNKEYFTMQKRLFLKIAENFAKKQKCIGLATGDSLGQVSSQTLSSLAVINESVTIPVMRPLLGLDKDKITKIAISANTYEISKGKETCDILGPKKPSAEPKLAEIKKMEKDLDLEKDLTFLEITLC